MLERNCFDIDESNEITDQTFAVLTLNKTLTGYIGPCIFILLLLSAASPPRENPLPSSATGYHGVVERI